MSNLEGSFFAKNRSRLRQRFFATNPSSLALVIAGNHHLQASADITQPFVQDSNFFYLTGLREPGQTLVITPEDEFIIEPQHDAVRAAFDGVAGRDQMIERSNVHDILHADDGWKRLGKLLGSGISKSSRTKPVVGILEPIDPYIPQLLMFANPSRRYVKDRLKEIAPDAEYVDVRPELTALRSIKSSPELMCLQEAIDHTCKAFQDIEAALGSASNESDLLAAFTQYKIVNQLEFAYDPIIAGGKNAVTLHYSANNSSLQENSLVLLDIGLRVDGYNADITRTVAHGQPTDRQQAVHDAVSRVQQVAFKALQPGVLLKDYEEQMEVCLGEELMALGVIDSPDHDAIRRYYPHRTSHFLGIDVHDVGNYDKPLEPGMVMTVEPGIYIPEEGIGVRIEDNILITKTGNTNLSKQLSSSSTSLTMKSNA